MQRIWVYVIEKGLCKLNMSLYTGLWVREMILSSETWLKQKWNVAQVLESLIEGFPCLQAGSWVEMYGHFGSSWILLHQGQLI